MRILLVIIALAAPLAAQSKLASNPAVADQIRLIESWCRGQVEDKRWPGLAVVVVQGEEVVWKSASGYADLSKKTPMTAAMLFRMASNSKMFTALAMLQLRDAGKLSLDDPVKKYLPWFDLKTAREDGTFTIDAKSGSSSIGEKAEFLRDAAGKVSKMRLGWYEFDRERP
jgi:CubicO group peptidase (beta-lactamase class C family)